MSLRDIITYPDPILRQKCALVSKFGSDLQKLANDMTETMYASGGIGLAAIQIAELIQLAVVDVSENRSQLLVLVNPEITGTKSRVSSEEGCLSIPGYRDTIKRHEEITVNYKDLKGNSQQLNTDGMLAICIQHEVDHLNGILFVDHLSRLKREFFKRWAKKNLEENFESK